MKSENVPWLGQIAELLLLVQSMVDVYTQGGNLGMRRLWPCLKETVEIGNANMLAPKRLYKLVAFFQPPLLDCFIACQHRGLGCAWKRIWSCKRTASSL